jgi:hypothetical protein
MATLATMLAQYIIFTVLGYVSLFIAVITSFIKDAPCEVSDQFIATHMSKYRLVINGSIKRGVIKGTNIENGTRYVQILNCAPILPVRTFISFSNSDKISSCLIPVNNLLLKCTDKFLFIFSILP